MGKWFTWPDLQLSLRPWICISQCIATYTCTNGCIEGALYEDRPHGYWSLWEVNNAIDAILCTEVGFIHCCCNKFLLQSCLMDSVCPENHLWLVMGLTALGIWARDVKFRLFREHEILVLFICQAIAYLGIWLDFIQVLARILWMKFPETLYKLVINLLLHLKSCLWVARFVDKMSQSERLLKT